MYSFYLRFAFFILLVSCKSAEVRISETIKLSSPGFVKTLEGIASQTFTKNNSVQIIPDGKETFQVLFDMITKAKRSIHIESFFYGSDSTGTALTNLLIDKAREGVEIRIIIDSWGSARISSYITALKKIGVQVYFYNPMKFYNPVSYHIRNHRRLIIVDGHKAITGGFGLTAWWYSVRLDRTHVNDTQIYVEGESAAYVQRIFAESWYRISGELLAGKKIFPTKFEKKNTLVAPIGSEPNLGYDKFYRIFLLAIRSSEKEILITTPYFLPDVAIVNELKKALRRGVQVSLLLPDPKFVEEFPVVYASKRHYPKLVQLGMKLYHYKKRMLHSKRAVFDGKFSIVGSSNLDYRSLFINEEADIMVYDTNIGKKLIDLFNKEIKNSRSISLEETKDRNCLKKTFEGLWILLEFIL
ncbi:MAG: hypothetical protein H7A23_05840 [Leptospiraceae bacterium]|nr:hypothetical protein [Leptospiraceae bacterium]MCP5494060.1 hypothetical protein [Leptospiraceae bacterium]